jgi:hypothetical protein
MKTTSYKISEKLARIGFKKNHNYHYRFGCDTGWVIEIGIASEKCGDIPAYDLETIIESLPTEINVEKEKAWLSLDFCTYRASIGYGSDGENYTNKLYFSKKENESLVNAAARLLILLHEKGLINFNEER